MGFCTACGSRLEPGQRFCVGCGASATGAVDAEQTVMAPPLPPAGRAQLPQAVPVYGGQPAQPPYNGGSQPPAPTGSRRLVVLIAAVVAVALVVGGAVWYVKRSGTTQAGGDEQNVANFSSQPSLKWRTTASQLAPGLGCSASSGDGSDSSGSSCSVSAQIAGDTVLVTAVNGNSSELVGVDRASGKVKWHLDVVDVPSCTIRSTIAWCVLTDSGPTTGGGTMNVASTILTINVASGKQLGRVPLPGGGAGPLGFVVGVDQSGAYVLAENFSSDSSTTVTASKIGNTGKVEWQKVLNLRTDANWARTYFTDAVQDGKLYLIGMEASGSQVVLNTTDGSLVQNAGPGHVVSVMSGTVISQQGTTGLQVGKTLVAQSSLDEIMSRDASGTPPILLSDSTPSDSDGSSPAAVPFTAVNLQHPAKQLFQLSGFSPLAYCGNVLYVASGAAGSGSSSSDSSSTTTVEALNPKTGDVRWQQVVSGEQSAWCTTGGVVVGSARSLVKLDSGSGKTGWTVAVGDGSIFGAPASGSQDGVVATAASGSDQVISYIN